MPLLLHQHHHCRAGRCCFSRKLLFCFGKESKNMNVSICWFSPQTPATAGAEMNPKLEVRMAKAILPHSCVCRQLPSAAGVRDDLQSDSDRHGRQERLLGFHLFISPYVPGVIARHSPCPPPAPHLPDVFFFWNAESICQGMSTPREVSAPICSKSHEALAPRDDGRMLVSCLALHSRRILCSTLWGHTCQWPSFQPRAGMEPKGS